MMMSLGQFVFSLPTLAYQDFQRQMAWKHPNTARVGSRDAHQFTGAGDETISLSGWLPLELAGSLDALAELTAMADTGAAFVLVEGTGRVYGEFIITDLSEGKSQFLSDGLPRKVDFNLRLKRTDLGQQIGD